MSISIAIWGSPGSGKTAFSAALAQRLTKRFSAVLLVGADKLCPTFPIWKPDGDTKDILPIAEIVSNPALSEKYILENLITLPKNQKLALMGYRKEDSIESYVPLQESESALFLQKCKNVTDIVVVDCTYPNYDNLSSAALRTADIVLTLLDPTIKGTAFFYSMNQYFNLSDKNADHLIIASKAKEDSPLQFVSDAIGRHFDEILPYSEEVYQNYSEGKLFSEYRSSYGEVVNRLASWIEGDG